MGHLLLEALDSIHDAGEHHGTLAPEWVGFDAEGVLRVRARPDCSGPSDIDPTAGPQDTDCWSVGGLVYFLLGGDWPPTEVVSMPDFGGMDTGRARLALSGLLRKNPRLRLKPARFARQAVAAAVQDIEAAEEELRSLLSEFGCGGALRDTAPVLPHGLDSNANQALIQAFTNAVAPTGTSPRIAEPAPAEVSAPKSRSPIQIELALPDSEEVEPASDTAFDEATGPAEEAPADPGDELPVEEESLVSPVEEAANEESDDTARVGEDAGVQQEFEEEASSISESADFPAAEESPTASEGDRAGANRTVEAEHDIVSSESAEEVPSGRSPIRVQIAPLQEEPEPVNEGIQEVGKQPLEVEPFRMPLPESVPSESGGTAEPVQPEPESPPPAETPSEAQAVRIQMPLPQQSAEVKPVPEVPPAEEASVDSVPILIPQPELPEEAFEEEILSEEELDALLATPIDEDRLEPVQEVDATGSDAPSDPPGLSSEELAALEEEADWSLNVEVGTRSDLDEDLGPGKWVESGRSPEELARELDSMPVVDREFNLNP